MLGICSLHLKTKIQLKNSLSSPLNLHKQEIFQKKNLTLFYHCDIKQINFVNVYAHF